jgi:hypothetical protein
MALDSNGEKSPNGFGVLGEKAADRAVAIEGCPRNALAVDVQAHVLCV